MEHLAPPLPGPRADARASARGDAPVPDPAGPSLAAAAPRWLSPAFRALPLSQRLLLANGAVVALGAGVGTLATAEIVRRSPGIPVGGPVGGFVVAGVLLSLAVNAWVLRWALRPLDRLERAAGRVQDGDEPTGARVPVPAGADEQMTRLVDAFNGMLRTVAAYRARLRRLAVRALETAEDERSRLAADLQDDIAQRIATCLLHIQLARRSQGETREEALEELRREAGNTLEAIRRMARGLRPPELDELGLENAVRALVRSLARRPGPDLELEMDAVDGRLSAPERLVLYRGVQEALDNVRRHADARHVRIRLSRERDDAVWAEVRDDGRGFDADGALSEDTGSLGLLGIRERALYVGGDVSVASRPGAGTRIRIRVPGSAEPGT